MLFKLVLFVCYLVFFTLFKRIDYIHAWCTPGGAIGYLISIITRKKLILDSFEPHAETMVEGNTWKKNSVAYKLLFRFEYLQLKKANEIICAAKGMIDHSKKIYGVSKPRYFVKPACVNLNLFNLDVEAGQLRTELKLKTNVCVYAGKFGGIYLEREVFDFFKVAYDYWNGDFTVLLLSAHSEEEILNYCKSAGLPFETVVKKFVPHSEVPKYLSLGTFGFCPVKPLPSKEFCTPIKNGEYWAMGLPVVITKNISDDSRIIDESQTGYTLQNLNQKEYLMAIKTIDQLVKEPGIKSRIYNLAVKHRSFNISDTIYRTIYG